MLYVESDNALGSRTGDVDDAFAVAALLRAGQPIAALGSVFGNTGEASASRNNLALASLCGWQGTFLRGAASAVRTETMASRFLADPPETLRVVALGPLTNLAAALRRRMDADSAWSEVICVGSDLSSRGRWPPVWPKEFNLTQDALAACEVFGCNAPLTLVPLDVAKRMTVTRADLARIEGTLGARLRAGASRWLLRARLIKWSSSFPVWDLVAALYVLDPSLFELEDRSARAHPNGWIEYAGGPRRVKVVTKFDCEALWSRFLQIVNS